MKLRIRGSSIRLRLTQSEVGRVASEGRIEDAIDFGNAKLAYAFAAGDTLRATYTQNRIEVTAPAAQIARWAASEDVGIEGKEGALHILVEKDFACLKPRSEDDADAFPNPNETC
jgi:hypothetical protein